MTDFPATFNTGDTLTADYFNQMIEAVLARTVAVSFDQLNLSGTVLLFIYNVPSDMDQILTLATYSDNSVAGDNGCNVELDFTNMEGDQQLNTDILQNPNAEGLFGTNYTLKAKRGTQVIFNWIGSNGCIGSCGGALTIIKSIS